MFHEMKCFHTSIQLFPSKGFPSLVQLMQQDIWNNLQKEADNELYVQELIQSVSHQENVHVDIIKIH